MTPMGRHLAIVTTLAVVTSCGGGRSLPVAPEASERIELAISGRSNSAPFAAALGQTVAVVWTASLDGQSDIYMSISTDGGARFGAPVRVNDVDGDARASGEQAAQVAIAPGGMVHVVWPSRREGFTEIRYARSTDGGQTFSKATTIAGERQPGARGWQSMALGYDGGVHALWLDGRNAAPTGGRKGAHAGHSAGGQGRHSGHGSVADGAPRQDVFHVSLGKPSNEAVAPSERLVAENVCFCCKTAIATSGDRVYAAWRHIYPGNIRDIAVARSVDNGATFGEPVRLSVDDWKIAGCPDDGPSMVSDGHGGIHVT
jgi:hypothetical protein